VAWPSLSELAKMIKGKTLQKSMIASGYIDLLYINTLNTNWPVSILYANLAAV
jgi:hypothetical protein